MIRGRAALLGTLVAAVALTALPATADDTTGTFTVTDAGAALSISVPASHDFGAASAGTSLVGNLGTVEVDDQRGNLIATWEATVTSTDFVLDTAGAEPPAAAVLSPGAITYDPGTLTMLLGLSADLTVGAAGTLDGGHTAATYAGAGSNTGQWDPELTFAIPGSQVEGSYSGTITHSVQ